MSKHKKTATLEHELKTDDANRNELFAGRHERLGGTGPLGTDALEHTVDELVRQAQNTHADTTATAQRALRVVEQSKYVQEQTMAELELQKKKIQGLDQKLTKVNEDLTYSERILRYMRRCFCCWLCDSCTGADPEEQVKKAWEGRVDSGDTQTMGEKVKRPPPKDQGPKDPRKALSPVNGEEVEGEAVRLGADGKPLQFRDPDIKLTPQHQTQETRLHTETRKQNEIIDQIGTGLEQMLANAKNIGAELEKQTEEAADLQERMENTKGRLQNVNTKSQLSEFRVKK